MALFSSNKKTATKKTVKAAAAPAVSQQSKTSYAHILVGPRITEKATDHQYKGVYTFDVAANATKRDVIRAVHLLYKVTPRMVRVVSRPAKVKRNMRTGRTTVIKSGRKACVYLKSGETITIA